MSRSNDELDDLIREALGQPDGELLLGDADPSMAERLTEVFRGRHRFLAVGGGIANLVLFVLAVFSGVQLLRATDERAMLLWGAAMLLCFVAVTAIKIWYWLEMNRLALTREIKRLELRVAQIARRLEE
jgi:hypothetical protein